MNVQNFNCTHPKHTHTHTLTKMSTNMYSINDYLLLFFIFNFINVKTIPLNILHYCVFPLLLLLSLKHTFQKRFYVFGFRFFFSNFETRKTDSSVISFQLHLFVNDEIVCHTYFNKITHLYTHSLFRIVQQNVNISKNNPIELSILDSITKLKLKLKRRIFKKSSLLPTEYKYKYFLLNNENQLRYQKIKNLAKRKQHTKKNNCNYLLCRNFSFRTQNAAEPEELMHIRNSFHVIPLLRGSV